MSERIINLVPLQKLRTHPSKPDMTDNMLWEVPNTVWQLNSYAKNNVPNLKIDMIAIKIILGGGNVFWNEQSLIHRETRWRALLSITNITKNVCSVIHETSIIMHVRITSTHIHIHKHIHKSLQLMWIELAGSCSEQFFLQGPLCAT